MRTFITLSALLAVTIAAGCANPSNTNVASKNAANTKPSAPRTAATPHPDEGRDAPRISLAEAKKHFDDKTAVFIDTHTKEQFEFEHIPGAVNIQANTIKQNMDKVPRGKKIIVYCS